MSTLPTTTTPTPVAPSWLERRPLMATVFVVVACAAFALLFDNFKQHSPDGALANQTGLSILEVFFGVTVVGGALTLARRGVGTLATFFSALTLVLLIYGRRVASQYLFQDDFHHVLPTARLGWIGLWTPFVDHITPLWRLWHWIPIEALGAYSATYAFPVLGALNLALLSATLFHCLRRRGVSAAFFWSLLVVVYPGFQRVMYWMSTNAMVLSSILGILALDWYERAEERQDSSARARVRVLLLLIGSIYLWSTGLAFALFLLAVPVAERVVERLRSKPRVAWAETLRSGWLAVPAVALGVFAATRLIVFRLVGDEYLQTNLWLLNAREHGHTPMLLRPLLWPFASYWQGTLVYGVFGAKPVLEARAALGDGPYFFTSFTIGLGLLALALAFGLARGGRSRNLYRAVLFPLSLFAIIFAGRGQTLIGSDFLAYGLDNDWYRITVVSGMIWFLALSVPPLSWRNQAMVGLVSLVFAAISVQRSRSLHPIETFAKPTIDRFERMRCLERLSWTEGDFAFASKYLYLPLAGSNPGNYWTGYQPSYFDLFFRRSPTTLIPPGPLDVARAERLEDEVQAACGSSDWRDQHAWFSGDFPVAPGRFRQVPIVESDEGLALSLRDAGHCELGENQLLRLTWAATKTHQGPVSVQIDGRPYALTNMRGYPSDVGIEPGMLNTLFELRTLAPRARCAERLTVSMSIPGLELESAALVKGPMFEDLHAPTPPPIPGARPRGTCGRMVRGQELLPGNAVSSCDGRFRLTMQEDGNLVLYQGSVALWSTQTQNGRHAVMQEDGNFVLYGANDEPLFWAGTNGSDYLAVQDDGDLAVYDASGPRWKAGTCCR